ncbi:MAG: hypothetical protein ACLR4C_05055 [Eubacterium ventriosum]
MKKSKKVLSVILSLSMALYVTYTAKLSGKRCSYSVLVLAMGKKGWEVTPIDISSGKVR